MLLDHGFMHQSTQLLLTSSIYEYKERQLINQYVQI